MLFSTYNIHYGVGADGKYDVSASPTPWPRPT